MKCPKGSLRRRKGRKRGESVECSKSPQTRRESGRGKGPARRVNPKPSKTLKIPHKPLLRYPALGTSKRPGLDMGLNG